MRKEISAIHERITQITTPGEPTSPSYASMAERGLKATPKIQVVIPGSLGCGITATAAMRLITITITANLRLTAVTVAALA
jgi:hypothetical protein